MVNPAGGFVFVRELKFEQVFPIGGLEFAQANFCRFNRQWKRASGFTIGGWHEKEFEAIHAFAPEFGGGGGE